MSRSCPLCGRSFPDKVFFCGEDGTITVQDQDPQNRDARLGQQLGGYIVVAQVADGAMGRVYEGRHAQNKSRVAIKVLHPAVAQDRVAVERFKREYETAGELKDPRIIKVLEFGDTPDGSYFMTMEYLEGEELRKVLERDHFLSKERIVRVVCQVALALEYAHSFGFIHRDLKPDNIFLCVTPEGDAVRILDFGSVKLQMETGPKLTALGTTLGSPYYMSPEQAKGALDVDQRTDVFALSAILYEMITGKVAFGAPNVAQILVKIMHETPSPPSSLNPASPQSVDDVVEKGLRKDKTRRYASAVEFAQALVAAYGLSGTVEQWAGTPQKEIKLALDRTAPPPPKPFDAVSVPPPVQQAAKPTAAAAPVSLGVWPVTSQPASSPRASAPSAPAASSGGWPVLPSVSPARVSNSASGGAWPVISGVPEARSSARSGSVPYVVDDEFTARMTVRRGKDLVYGILIGIVVALLGVGAVMALFAK